MTTSGQIGINVSSVPGCNEVDEGLQGVYLVTVEPEGTVSQRVTAALNLFHDETGIDVLDDFEIVAFDPEIGLLLEEVPEEEELKGPSRPVPWKKWRNSRWLVFV